MLKFGPNPFTDQLMVDLKTETQTLVQAVIYDLKGTPLHTLINSRISQGYHHYLWNGKNAEGNSLPAGIYTMVIRTGSGMSNSYKLVKIR
jgi:flagellar hook assembly protein FlgD